MAQSSGAPMPSVGNWAATQLAAMGLPQTPQNLQNLSSWANAENGGWASGSWDGITPAQYNPLNTSYSVPGSSAINSSGVQAYPSLTAGVQATSLTLQNYPSILKDLAAGNVPTSQFSSDVAASPWGTGNFSPINVTSGNPVPTGTGSVGSATLVGSTPDSGSSLCSNADDKNCLGPHIPLMGCVLTVSQGRGVKAAALMGVGIVIGLIVIVKIGGGKLPSVVPVPLPL